MMSANPTSAEIYWRQSEIADAVTAKRFALQPKLQPRDRTTELREYHQKMLDHLSQLTQSLETNQAALFADYVRWTQTTFSARGMATADLIDDLKILRDVLRDQLPASVAREAVALVDQGLQTLSAEDESSNVSQTFISPAEPLGDLARAYLDALLDGRRDAASRLILQAVEKRGVSVKEIYLRVFQKTQYEIGRLWQLNEISVAQEHYATAATQLIMSQLYPHIFAGEKNGRRLVAACVAGDLHEIGLRMVADFFEMDGWDTFYLGANAPAEAVVQTIKDRHADATIISATMTFHLRAVRELIERIRADEQTRKVKILVGGYPFNLASELWRAVGADAFSHDAQRAVEIAHRLLHA